MSEESKTGQPENSKTLTESVEESVQKSIEESLQKSTEESVQESIDLSKLTFKEGIAVEVTRSSGCKVRMTVHIEPAFASQKRAAAFKTIAKKISLPGFRKGKAPQSYIEKNFAREIFDEWSQHLAESTLQQALEQEKMNALGSKGSLQAHWEELSTESISTITYQFESFPEIPEIDLTQIRITLPEKSELTQEEIDEKLGDLVRLATSYERVEEPASEGLWVSFAITHGPDEEPETQRLECTAKAMGKSLFEHIQGMNAGDSKEIEYTPQGKRKKLSGTLGIVEVLKCHKPDSLDALAQTVGMENEEDLMARIKSSMEKGKENDYQNQIYEALHSAILDAAGDFDIPTSLYDIEIRETLSKLKADYAKEHNDQKPEGEDLEKLREQAREKAAKNVRNTCLIHTMATEKGIGATDEEVNTLLSIVVQDYELIKRIEHADEFLKTLRSKCFLHLTTDKLLHAIAKEIGLI